MMAKMPKIEVPVEVVPYIRYGDQWIKVSDLTPEQIGYLRESMEKVLPADVADMMARAYDQGYMAASALRMPPQHNPFREGQRD